MNVTTVKLNLGSGCQKIPGFINVDSCKEYRPDILWNLEKTPWPFKTSSVSHVLMSHSLEYLGITPLSFFKIWSELYRVCAPDATIEIVVYHPNHEAFISNPMHVRSITPTTISLFDRRRRKETNAQIDELLVSNYSDKIDFEIIQIQEKYDPNFIEEIRKCGRSFEENMDFFKQYSRNSVIEIYFQLTTRKLKLDDEDLPGHQLEGSSNCDRFPQRIQALLSRYISIFKNKCYELIVLYHYLIANRNRFSSLLAKDNPKSLGELKDNSIEKDHLDSLKVLIHNGNIDDALKLSHRFALENNHSSFALKSYGALLAKCDRFDEAVFYTNIATKIDPDDAEASFNLGILHNTLNNYNEALICLNNSIQSDPLNPNSHNALGISLLNSCRILEAIESFSKAIVLSEHFVEAYFNRGNCFFELGNYKDALENYERAIFYNVYYAEAYCGKGNTHFKLGNFEDALSNYDLAVIHKENYCEALNNRAAVYILLEKYARAISDLNRVLEINSVNAAAYLNRGIANYSLGKFESALADYDMSLKLGWSPAEVKYHKSHLYLLTGELEEGFSLYESRKSKMNPIGLRKIDKPLLDKSSDILGKTILIYYEQGLGDTILFCRYLLLLEARGAKIIFEPQGKIASLISTINIPLKIVFDQPTSAEFDFHAPLMSLPYILGTSLETIPTFDRYLQASEDKVIFWREKLGGNGFKVAVAWQCSQRVEAAGRSFPISMFKNLTNIPSVRLISIQKHISQDKSDISPQEIGIELFGRDLDNGEDAFVDTAAIIVNCDLVITCDTSVAHLAGALGVPAWVVLKNVPHWVWLTSRKDCPWYPHMKLFRQSKPGHWDSAFAAIHEELVKLLEINASNNDQNKITMHRNA